MKFRRKRRVQYPDELEPQPSVGPAHMTVAAPISGEVLTTATNRPDDPHSWQNEPGPGFGQQPEEEVAHRRIADMERVERIKIPG
jgi:hypothetical protein